MAKKLKSTTSNKVETIGFMIAVAFFATLYGIYAEKKKFFPAQVVKLAEVALTVVDKRVFSEPWWMRATPHSQELVRKADDYSDNRLTKLVHFDKDRMLAVSVRNSDGTLMHKWPINWFDLWPDATHLNLSLEPKQKPGTMIHGAHIFPNGDMVFNFEYLGMIRLNACGKVVWRLPERTHHSIFIDEDGDIWTGVNGPHYKTDGGLLRRVIDPQIVKVSPGGEVVFRKSVMQLLEDNNMHGVIYTSAHHNAIPVVVGDSVHLNDVEVFPSSMKPGFFKPGDIMVSLRNPNTIIVFDPSDWSVKHVISNLTVRQHDPDFFDGNTITIFDNNNRWNFKNPNSYKFSRIIKVSVPENNVDVIFQGTKEDRFFTNTLGKHQWLENGNLLFTESVYGRALELSPAGEIVWEYINLIEPKKSGSMQEAERLPEYMNEAFFKEKTSECMNAG